jgi:hypothetical protein
LLAAAPLVMSLLNGGSTTGEAGVQRAAAEAQSMGKTLSSYQFSGTLPSGLQDVVNSQESAAEAALKSRYAGLGLAGSTMEGQALGQIKQAKAAQVAVIAQQLAAEGRSWSTLSADEFNKLMAAQQAQDTAFNASLAKFASGLAGGSGNSGKWSLTQD